MYINKSAVWCVVKCTKMGHRHNKQTSGDTCGIQQNIGFFLHHPPTETFLHTVADWHFQPVKDSRPCSQHLSLIQWTLSRPFVSPYCWDAVESGGLACIVSSRCIKIDEMMQLPCLHFTKIWPNNWARSRDVQAFSEKSHRRISATVKPHTPDHTLINRSEVSSTNHLR